MRKDWEVKKWSEVLSIINGKNQKKVEDSNGAYPIYGSGGVMGYASDYLCPGNSVIIGRKGNINKPLFVKEKFWNVDTAFGLISKEGVLDSKYLFYFCVYYNFEKLNKAVTIPSLTKTDLLNIRIDLPSLQIQQQIVEELDCLTSIVEKQKKQLEELDNLAQSIFYDMFGDPIENEKGWILYFIDDICVKKKFIERANRKYHLESIIYYIDISSVDNDNHTISQLKEIIYRDAPSRAQQCVKKNDILVSLVRPNLKNITLVDLIDDNLVASTGFCVLRTLKNVINEQFLKFCLLDDSFTDYLMNRVKGANYPAVNELDIKKYMVPVPPLPLQQQFAAKIEVIEKQKELIKKSIKETEDLFNSRMDYYFN